MIRKTIFGRQKDCVVNYSDADALVFITATGISDTTEQNAIYKLVSFLKCKGLWSKIKAIYPMVGGTASTHKYNLKDPRDLDVAFRLNFQGTWIHSATGAKPNGTNAYADTFLAPATHLTSGQTHMAVYHRTSLAISAAGLHGARHDSPAKYFNLYPYTYSVGILSDMYLPTTPDRIIASGGASTGFMLTSRTGINQVIYRNSSSIGSSTGSASSAMPTYNIIISASSRDSPAISNYSANEVALFSLGAGLTPTESLDYYNIVQAFQTALSRNV